MQPIQDSEPVTGTDGAAGAPTVTRDELTRVAGEVQALVGQGNLDQARERFAEVVARQQRRASRIAYHFLRDGAEADDAVQDAFLKVFAHIATYRPELPFEVWFTRILINGCLDRQKARMRRARWLVPVGSRDGNEGRPVETFASATPSPEEALQHRERQQRVRRAIGMLQGRQRDVFVLCHLDGRDTREVATLLGLNESTVRVHLFRAVHKLRSLLVEDGRALP